MFWPVFISFSIVFLGAVVLLIVSSGVSMAVPFCIGKVIDIIYSPSEQEKMKEKLTTFCQIMVGVFIVGAVANFGRVYLMSVSGKYLEIWLTLLYAKSIK